MLDDRSLAELMSLVGDGDREALASMLREMDDIDKSFFKGYIEGYVEGAKQAGMADVEGFVGSDI